MSWDAFMQSRSGYTFYFSDKAVDQLVGQLDALAMPTPQGARQQARPPISSSTFTIATTAHC